MGPENTFDLNNCTLFLGDTEIARGQIQLAEFTFLADTPELELKRALMFQCVEFTVDLKEPKRWRCGSRKRFIRLMMSEGMSRNYAERMADFVRGLMPYREAWRDYMLYGMKKERKK